MRRGACRPLRGLCDLDQLGHLAKVFGGRCEDELVTRAVWPRKRKRSEAALLLARPRSQILDVAISLLG